VLRRSYQQHQGAWSRHHNGAASPERLLEVDPVTAVISRGRLLVEPAHVVMGRRQLLSIRQGAEAPASSS
jgi:hypothetical protein